MVRKRTDFIRPIAALLIIAFMLFWFFTSLGNISEKQAEEGRSQLENAIRRASAACYAAEGVYPPDIDYIVSNYAIQIDDSRYAVFYEIFADNLMPEITVVIK